MRRPPEWWGAAAAFAAVYVIWGSTYLAIAWAVEGIPPMLMIGSRCLVAGSILYAWSRLRGSARPRRVDWWKAMEGGVLLFVTGQAVLAWAETRIPSGAASLLIATEPLFVALLAWRGGWLTGGSRIAPGRSALIAVPLGFVGVAVLVLPGGGSGGGLDPLGAGAAVLAAFSWSVGILRSRSGPGIGPVRWAGMQLLTAGAVLLAVSPLMEEPGSVVDGGVSLRAVLAFLYLVIFGSVVTFGAYVWLLERVGATRISSHAYVNPLVAVALGVTVNDEPLHAGVVVAAVLIVAAVALLLSTPAQRRAGLAVLRRITQQPRHRRQRGHDRLLDGQGRAGEVDHVPMPIEDGCHAEGARDAVLVGEAQTRQGEDALEEAVQG